MTRQPWVKTVWILTGIVVAAIIAITALVYAYIGERNSSQAKTQSLAIAQCVNEVLALRQTPAAQDSAAYDELFAEIGDVLTAPTGAPADAAYAKFLATLQKDNQLLKNNQAFRVAHPLGRC